MSIKSTCAGNIYDDAAVEEVVSRSDVIIETLGVPVNRPTTLKQASDDQFLASWICSLYAIHGRSANTISFDRTGRHKGYPQGDAEAQKEYFHSCDICDIEGARPQGAPMVT